MYRRPVCAGFVMDAFASHGVNYKHRDPAQAAGYLTTSDNFAGLIPILNSGRCRLLDNKRLAAQLCALSGVSRRWRQGSISHPPGGHDDLGAAVAGLMVRLFGTRVIRLNRSTFRRPAKAVARSPSIRRRAFPRMYRENFMGRRGRACNLGWQVVRIRWRG